MNQNEYFKRIGQIFRPEQLRSKRAVIVGAGSGGSRVATELGRLGLPLILIDLPGEKLQEHNILRHELGYASLGKSKVTELARHIHNLNPDTPIETFELDVTAQTEEFQRLVAQQRPNVLLACTDNQPSKHAIDEVAATQRFPVVGAGVFDGGVAGEVYLTRPGMACYGCITAHLQLDARRPKKDLNLDYNHLDLSEVQSTPALNLDIAQIALIHTRIALTLLLAGDSDLLGLPPEVNLIVFANRLVPGHFERPLHAEFYHIAKQGGCLVCGASDPNVEAEADRILALLPTEQNPS